nr:hypothetical protein [uncultured Prevotella sp.]
MEKSLGQDITDLQQREQLLKDNAETIEDVGYSKPLKSNEVEKIKEQLSDSSIKLFGLEEEKKSITADYGQKIKVLKNECKDAAEKLKTKSVYVSEPCYKIVDSDEREVGYYNKEGLLVYERPARQEELQPRIFPLKNTGTTGGNG